MYIGRQLTFDRNKVHGEVENKEHRLPHIDRHVQDGHNQISEDSVDEVNNHQIPQSGVDLLESPHETVDEANFHQGRESQSPSSGHSVPGIKGRKVLNTFQKLFRLKATLRAES